MNSFMGEGSVGGKGREDLLSIDELSQYLHVAPKTLRNWVSGKKVPYIKINGAVRFSRKKIDKWLERKTVDVTKEKR